MFEGSWTQVKVEESEDSGVVSSDELSDEGTESSGSHDPNGELIQRPQETVEEFIRRIHGDDAERVFTGYHESPALDLGVSIGSAESHRGASLPEVLVLLGASALLNLLLILGGSFNLGPLRPDLL